MRQKIDLADLYADALAGVPEELDATMPRMQPSCVYRLSKNLRESRITFRFTS
jgi:hypothetical protein